MKLLSKFPHFITAYVLIVFLNSCKGVKSNLKYESNYQNLEKNIADKLDSASKGYLKFKGLKITVGLDDRGIVGQTTMVMFEGMVCPTEDIQWNGLLVDQMGSNKLFDMKIEPGNDANTGLLMSKDICLEHNGWATFVKETDGWKLIGYNFFH